MATVVSIKPIEDDNVRVQKKTTYNLIGYPATLKFVSVVHMADFAL